MTGGVADAYDAQVARATGLLGMTVLDRTSSDQGDHVVLLAQPR